MSADRPERVFNVPTLVVGLIGLFVLVHLGRQMLDAATDDWVVTTFALVPARFGETGSRWPAPDWAGPVSLLAHALLHGDLTHLVVNSAWLLAVGTPLARRLPPVRFLVFTALCGIGGALLFLAMNAGLDRPMVGASGAVSGLMAAMFRLMFAARSGFERHLLREHPAAAPVLSLAATFANRQAVFAIVVWVAINIIFAYGFGTTMSEGGIAWEAHIGGFFTGLLAFGLFDRPRPAGPLPFDRDAEDEA